MENKIVASKSKILKDLAYIAGQNIKRPQVSSQK